ncbi:MAG: aminotransferase class V, partial [Pseudomonadota bacterium]
MTTNSLNLASVHDLSSFEPEAILASLPGEHPRMAAGLAIGRTASQTGHLDVAELSRIASELYAEGFPAGAFGKSATEIPSTASLSDAREPAAQGGQSSVPDLSSYLPSLASAANTKSLDDLSAAHLQYAANFENQFEIGQLLGGVDIPQQAQLNALLADTGVNSAATGQPISPPNFAQANAAQPDFTKSGSGYYFLQDLPGASQNT